MKKKITSNQFFWLPSREDLYCWLLNGLILAAIYISLHLIGKLRIIVFFQDLPNELIFAKHMNNSQLPSIVTEKYPLFTLHSYILKGFLIVFNSNYILTCISSSLLFSMLSTYLFRRLLIVYKCVESPFLSTLAYCFVSGIGIAFRASATNDTLFFCFVLFSLIFFKTSNYALLLVNLALATLTRPEGFILIIAILVMSAIKKQLLMSAFIFIEFVVFIFYFIGNNMLNINTLKEISLNKELSEKSFRFISYLFKNETNNISNLRTMHSVLFQLTVIFLGILGILNSDTRIIAVFPICMFIALLFIDGDSLLRVSLPAFFIAVIVGFDSIISSKKSRKAIIAFSLIFALPVNVIYAKTFIAKYSAYSASLARFL